MQRFESMGPEKPPTIEILEIHTVEEIEEFFKIANSILNVDSVFLPEEYRAKHIALHPKHTQIFTVRDNGGGIIAGCKVTKLFEESEKIRLGLNKGLLASKKGCLLEYLFVCEDRRREGIQKQLTEKRIKWARKHKAEYVCTEIDITNPVSLYSKFSSGFNVISVKESAAGIDRPYFVLIKLIPDFSEIYEENENPTGEIKEISLREMGNFKEGSDEFKKSQEELISLHLELDLLLSNGWAVTDVSKPKEDDHHCHSSILVLKKII